MSISNDLYGNDTLSAFELAKGFTKPVMSNQALSLVPHDVITAHEQLQARRKLALILKSKATKEIPIQVSELVEVYQKKQHEKRGKWSVPKPVILVDQAARSVTVPASNNRVLTIALENIRAAIPQDSLASTVQLGIDELDQVIDELLTKTGDEENDAALDRDCVESNTPATSHQSENDFAADFSSDKCNVLPVVGDRISIYWSDDNEYYPGVIQSENNDGHLNVQYDDGDEKCLDMNNEKWKFLPASSAKCATNSVATELSSTEPTVLATVDKHFENKPFLKHEAQGFEQFPLVNAFAKEEVTFLKTVRSVPKDRVPSGSNIIGSHTLYNVKRCDDGVLKPKARIV